MPDVAEELIVAVLRTELAIRDLAATKLFAGVLATGGLNSSVATHSGPTSQLPEFAARAARSQRYQGAALVGWVTDEDVDAGVLRAAIVKACDPETGFVGVEVYGVALEAEALPEDEPDDEDD